MSDTVSFVDATRTDARDCQYDSEFSNNNVTIRMATSNSMEMRLVVNMTTRHVIFIYISIYAIWFEKGYYVKMHTTKLSYHTVSQFHFSRHFYRNYS